MCVSVGCGCEPPLRAQNLAVLEMCALVELVRLACNTNEWDMNDRFVDEIATLLDDTQVFYSRNVREAAVRCLANCREDKRTRHIDKITALLDDPYGRVRQAAVIFFSKCTVEERAAFINDSKQIARLLTDENGFVWHETLSFFAECSTEERAPHMDKSLLSFTQKIHSCGKQLFLFSPSAASVSGLPTSTRSLLAFMTVRQHLQVQTSARISP